MGMRVVWKGFIINIALQGILSLGGVCVLAWRERVIHAWVLLKEYGVRGNG